MKVEGQPTEGRKDQDHFSQQDPGSRIQALKAEAKRLGWKYWIRVVIGFFVMIFLAGFVCNAYLQFKYSEVFQESPCNLCLDLNDPAAKCLNDSSTYLSKETSWITIHPLNELGSKAAWLQIPCDVCAELNPKEKDCLDSLFHPEQQIEKNNNLYLSEINFTLQPSS